MMKVGLLLLGLAGWITWLNRRVFQPAVYHGHGKSGLYFEGWYFKSHTADGGTNLAVIPGVFQGDDVRNSEAFVIVLHNDESHYFRYPVAEFEASATAFDVRIGPNRFSLDGYEIDLKPGANDDASSTFKGKVRVSQVSPWISTWSSPGVMGWYGYIPFMECFHGVMSMDHVLAGEVAIDDKPASFAKGRGYIEKDWGVTFPQSWIWFQSNNFAGSPGTSIFVSVARVPFAGFTFPGFIVGFQHAGKLHRFASYTDARFETLDIEQDSVSISLSDSQNRLDIVIQRENDPDRGGLLYGPKGDQMTKFVREVLGAQAKITLSNKNTGDVIFSGTGVNGGQEIAGDVQWLSQNLHNSRGPIHGAVDALYDNVFVAVPTAIIAIALLSNLCSHSNRGGKIKSA